MISRHVQQARSININYTDLANSRLDKSSHACTRDASKSWHCTLHRLQRGVARCVPRTGNTQARNKACARQSVAQLRYWSWPELVSVSVFSFWRFRRLFRFNSGKFASWITFSWRFPRIDKQKAKGKNYTMKLWNNFEGLKNKMERNYLTVVALSIPSTSTKQLRRTSNYLQSDLNRI